MESPKLSVECHSQSFDLVTTILVSGEYLFEAVFIVGENMTYPPTFLEGEGDEESRLLPLREEQPTSSPSSSSSVRSVRSIALFFVGTLALLSGFLIAFPREKKHLLNLALEVEDEVQQEVKNQYVPAGCPGQQLLDGITDPRDVVVNGGDLAGLGDYGYEEAAGMSLRILPTSLFVYSLDSLEYSLVLIITFIFICM